MTDENNKYQAPTSTIEKLIERQLDKASFKRDLIKHKEKWKQLVNRVASTPDGKFFLQMLVTHSEIFNLDQVLNPAKLVEDRGRKEFYLNHVRPYLDKTNKNKIEV